MKSIPKHTQYNIYLGFQLNPSVIDLFRSTGLRTRELSGVCCWGGKRRRGGKKREEGEEGG